MSYENIKRGWYKTRDGGKIYMRSGWERKYAALLDELAERGKIVKWEYEAERFAFPVKRGCIDYLPDFKVTMPDGRIEYHEVKGWMDAKSATKLKRMAKYFPEITIKVISKVQ